MIVRLAAPYRQSLDAIRRIPITTTGSGGAAVQIALLIASVATARALMAEHVHPVAVAGMSIGAFGAAVACGTLSFAEALPLVHLRGELMQTAFPSGFGLAAIEGLNEVQVEGIVERTRTAQAPVYISNINAPRQIVVAGSDPALAAVIAQARQQGARRAEPLRVSVPSHCPLLQPIAARLGEEMAKLSLQPPLLPYVSNRGGRPLRGAAAIRADLATSIAHPVRWSRVREAPVHAARPHFLHSPKPGGKLSTKGIHVSGQVLQRIDAPKTPPGGGQDRVAKAGGA